MGAGRRSSVLVACSFWKTLVFCVFWKSLSESHRWPWTAAVSRDYYWRQLSPSGALRACPGVEDGQGLARGLCAQRSVAEGSVSGGMEVPEETLDSWGGGRRAPGHRLGTGQRQGTKTQRAEVALCPIPKEVTHDRHTQPYWSDVWSDVWSDMSPARCAVAGKTSFHGASALSGDLHVPVRRSRVSTRHSSRGHGGGVERSHRPGTPGEGASAWTISVCIW